MLTWLPATVDRPAPLLPPPRRARLSAQPFRPAFPRLGLPALSIHLQNSESVLRLPDRGGPRPDKTPAFVVGFGPTQRGRESRGDTTRGQHAGRKRSSQFAAPAGKPDAGSGDVVKRAQLGTALRRAAVPTRVYSALCPSRLRGMSTKRCILLPAIRLTLFLRAQYCLTLAKSNEHTVLVSGCEPVSPHLQDEHTHSNSPISSWRREHQRLATGRARPHSPGDARIRIRRRARFRRAG